MELARLVGKEVRKYEKDGQNREYCGLHLVYAEGSVDGIEGSKVSSVSCPRKVAPSRLEIGQLYELQYEIYTMKGQTMARLVNLVPVEG